jgi:pimeloyl-ACP methyl ester carboxylesterase
MIIEKNNIIKTEGKKSILFDLYYNSSTKPKPIVIFCHGYKGFKDWGAWHLVAKKFAENGFFFLKFNFSHNGSTIEEPIDFPDLESFAENNFSKELEDLDRVLDYIVSINDCENILLKENISLIGHSRGSGIVLIKAEEDNRIKKVISWAGVCDFKARFQEGTEAFLQWKKTGKTYVENVRTKQKMPHNWQFYKDFKNNEERLTIKRAVVNLKIPQLIIHGDEDPTVQLKEAKALHNWNSNSKLEVIKGGDHVFGAMHPWDKETLPKNLENVVEKTISFIK